MEQLGLTTFLYANYWESGKYFLGDYRQTYDENPFVTKFSQWRWCVAPSNPNPESIIDGLRWLIRTLASLSCLFLELRSVPIADRHD